MEDQDDLSRFCCQNPRCALYGRRDGGNLYVRDHYGKSNTRLLCCKQCKKRFSERKGTVLFNSKLPVDKSLAVLEHVNEGCGVRQTARLMRVTRGSVQRLVNKAGPHAKALHDELLAFSPADPRSAVRREVVVRTKKAAPLPRRESGRLPARRQLGPCGL